jgi:hypothetical protein
MWNELIQASANAPPERVVFVHSEGQRRFFGRSRDERRGEATVAAIQALASAGFDIVEVDMREGRPLCTVMVPARDWRHLPTGVALPRRRRRTT